MSDINAELFQFVDKIGFAFRQSSNDQRPVSNGSNFMDSRMGRGGRIFFLGGVFVFFQLSPSLLFLSKILEYSRV